MDNTHYVPGGKKCFIDIFGPWRNKCFIDIFGPWRNKCFIDPFGPWRHKSYKRATPLGSIFIMT
jgi:hypothetical protein